MEAQQDNELRAKLVEMALNHAGDGDFASDMVEVGLEVLDELEGEDLDLNSTVRSDRVTNMVDEVFSRVDKAIRKEFGLPTEEEAKS